MTLKGIVNRIVVDNGKGFKIFFLSLSNSQEIPEDKVNPQYPNSITVTGTFMELQIGYVIEVTGEWTYRNNGEYHPWEFSAKSYKIAEMENNPLMMINYLSKTLKGVGQTLATSIVNEFGKDTFDIIENEYISLCRIKRITPDKAELIHRQYMEHQTLRKLTEYLSPFGLNNSQISSVQKQGYTVEQIKENPYILSNSNISTFYAADTIAADLGFENIDESRLEAAINYVFDVMAASQGHTYLDLKSAIENIRNLLAKRSAIKGELSETFIKRKIYDFVDTKLLFDDNGRIYKTYRYINECKVAKKLFARSRKKTPFADMPIETIEKCVKKAEKKLDIKLADMQKEAVIKAIQNITTIITGGPGTGKTTTLKTMLLTMDYLSEEKNIEKLSKVLAAPTGMASKRMKEATNMPSNTIHRLLDYSPYSDGEIRCKNEDDPIDGDVVVIDESSMIDIDLASMLLSAIPDTTMLIILGDVDQLPSVSPGNVLHDMIDSGKITVVKLNRTYRQGAESAILSNAQKINNGDTKLVFDKDDFKFIEIPDESDSDDGTKLRDTILKVYYEEFVLNGRDVNNIQVLCPMRKQSDFVHSQAVVNSLNPELQEAVNGCVFENRQMKYGLKKYRKGDKVMQLFNNYDKNVFNGDVGIITSVAPKENRLLVDYFGEKVEYRQEELDEIQHSFATTIHKSQGSEYPVVIIPVTMQFKMMLQRNLLYTALTRAKKKAYIIGDRKALNYAINNVSNQSRNSFLRERIINLFENPNINGVEISTEKKGTE